MKLKLFFLALLVQMSSMTAYAADSNETDGICDTFFDAEATVTKRNINYTDDDILPENSFPLRVDGICYEIFDDSNTAMVIAPINYNGELIEYEGDIVIPEKVRMWKETETWAADYIVTQISIAAFQNDVTTSIVIPGTIDKIPDDCFSSCSNLRRVTINHGVREIGERAFFGLQNLENVTFNNNYTTLTFQKKGCIIDAEAFKNCYNLKSINIPGYITSIGEAAFCNCQRLTDITIPKGVTSIGSDAFYRCYGLTSVTINCPTVGSWFSNNSFIQTIFLGECVTSIGDDAFWGCSGLTSINIPESVNSIGDYAFKDCSSLTSITIPNSVTDLGNNVFRACSSLTSIIIPNGVTSIGENAFQGCYGLTSVIIPNSVTSIGNKAFWGCESLTSITIPKSVTSIGTYAFCGCKGLESMVIPKGVKTIGSYAFVGCSGLTDFQVKKGNTKYDSRENCSAIIETATNTLLFGCMNTVIPQSITSLGDYSFYDCTGLTSLAIPNSVKKIGIQAFDNCNNLTSVTIPNSVKNIGIHAFALCSSLKDVYCFATSVPATEVINDNNRIFSELPDDATLHVPASSLKTYKKASNWKGFNKVVALTDEELTAIKNIENKQGIVGNEATEIYDLQGRRLSQSQRGVNIICTADGKTRKVLVK